MLMACGMMCLPKSDSGLSSSSQMTLAVENVDAHRGEVQFAAILDAEFRLPFRRQLERIQQRRVLRLFDEARDAPVVVNLHDAERLARRCAADGNGGDGDVRAGLDVLAR